MSELNRIKSALFTALSLDDALKKLDALNVRYYESDVFQMWVLKDHNIQFWESQSSRMALNIYIDNHIQCFDDRKAFLARQPEMAETQVPAASPDLAGERPLNEQSTESVDNKKLQAIAKALFQPAVTRAVIRLERRIRMGQKL